MLGKNCEKRNVFKCWRKMGRDGDDWMSGGSEFQRSDAVTGNVHRPTVVSRNDGTSSWCDYDELSWRRPGMLGTRTRSFRYCDARPCSTRMPWQPRWNWHVVVDAANVEQEHSRRDRCDLVGTPDEPRQSSGRVNCRTVVNGVGPVSWQVTAGAKPDEVCFWWV